MLILLVACMSHDNLSEVLDDVDAAAAGIDSFVADHVDAVGSAATVEEVATLESTYLSEWVDAEATMFDALDMASQCAMDTDDAASLQSCMTALADMATTITDHAAAGCATLEDCVAAEATHQAEMTGHTDTIRAARADWEDGTMECAMGGMDGMEM